MSMVKLIAPGSQQLDESVAELVKVASGGLRGADLGALVKRAGGAFARAVRDVPIAPGEVPVHLIALGSEERIGGNRNGDGFEDYWCKRSHDTFVKHARPYRNHKNRPTDDSYGVVKASAFNEPMGRIELLVCYNGTKAAADRNRGKVADKELDRLDKKDLSVSMACQVRRDVCTGCGNKAKTRAEYCTSPDEGGHCKRGGVRNNMCKVCADGHVLHVLNPDPKFFDISYVPRPADRIAYAFGKVASGTVVSGAELAEAWGVTAPDALDDADVAASPKAAAAVRLARELAGLERAVEKQGAAARQLAFAPAVQPALDWADHGAALPDLLGALAAAKVSMPPEGFLAALGDAGQAKVAAARVRDLLPGVYGRMLADGSLAALAADNPFAVPPGEPRQRLRLWALKRAADYGIGRDDAAARVSAAALYSAPPAPRRPALVKAASAADAAAEQLARCYALYKLALLQAPGLADGPDAELARELAVRQNYA